MRNEQSILRIDGSEKKNGKNEIGTDVNGKLGGQRFDCTATQPTRLSTHWRPSCLKKKRK